MKLFFFLRILSTRFFFCPLRSLGAFSFAFFFRLEAWTPFVSSTSPFPCLHLFLPSLLLSIFCRYLLASHTNIDATSLSTGVHDGINSETKLLESKKIRRMVLAEQIHQYQLNSIDSSLRADMKCAEDDYSVRNLLWSLLSFIPPQ